MLKLFFEVFKTSRIFNLATILKIRLTRIVLTNNSLIYNSKPVNKISQTKTIFGLKICKMRDNKNKMNKKKEIMK